MTQDQLAAFLRRHRHVVQSSVNPAGAPQSAVVGVVVTDALEVFFDTLGTSRKAQNLRANPRIAFVFGGWQDGDERTAQYEGVADEPQGGELDRLKALYFERFPDCREHQSWPDITYVRARPTWIRFSDWNVTPPVITEQSF